MLGLDGDSVVLGASAGGLGFGLVEGEPGTSSGTPGSLLPSTPVVDVPFETLASIVLLL